MSLFKIPIDVPISNWEILSSYGFLDTSFRDFIRFGAKGNNQGAVLACVEGLLSVIPQDAEFDENTFLLEEIETIEGLPETISLYLQIHLPLTTVPEFAARSSVLGGIIGFFYTNLATSSVIDALGETLERAQLPMESLTHREMFKQFLVGLIKLPVQPGQVLGQTARSSNSAFFDFYVYNRTGTIDPTFFFISMRDVLFDDNQTMDEFFNDDFIQTSWPVVDSDSKQAAINATKQNIYPFNILLWIKENFNLSYQEWRQIGSNQKELYRKGLLSRSGHPQNHENPDIHFLFNDHDFRNIFQLEAVVEFYINFNEPKGKDESPKSPNDDEYHVIDFIDQQGSNASIINNNVLIQDQFNLKQLVTTKGNTGYLYLEKDRGRSSKTYRILEVLNGNQLKLDGVPDFSGPSGWRLELPPTLVLIDPFGPRHTGRKAKIENGKINLTDAINLNDINPYSDTVYLKSEQTRKSKTFRIKSINNKVIAVYGTPNFEGESEWGIPAGVGGSAPKFNYRRRRAKLNQGYDCFGGMMFLINNSEVVNRFRFTSYTSRKHGEDLSNSSYASSVRGNQGYFYYSLLSGSKPGINFAYKVVSDAISLPNSQFAEFDSVDEGRFYFSENVTEDGDGKRLIRIHNSGEGTGIEWNSNGSDGCIVSTFFNSLNNLLIDIYLSRNFALTGLNDSEVAVLKNTSFQKKKTKIWKPNYIPYTRWAQKLFGRLWLIRPEERTFGKPEEESDK